MIIFELQLGIDKYKPAMMMLLSLVMISGYYYFSGDSPDRFDPLTHFLIETKAGIFSLIIFMAFMWMIVELLNERDVFGALNQYSLDLGLGPRGLFWATGFLCFMLSPFFSSITTALIFGRSTKRHSINERYTHANLCNIIIASNAGIWFVGVSTTLMVMLSHKVTMLDILYMIPASFIGWVAGALVLDIFYLGELTQKNVLRKDNHHVGIKPGGISLSIISFLVIIGAVILNQVFHPDLEFALGVGLTFLLFRVNYLKRQGIQIELDVQLQKVEWTTLLYYIGIMVGVAALNHVGWLSYVNWLFENFNPTSVNTLLGLVSCCVDNNVLEAAVLAAKPNIQVDQWALNIILIAIGGSLTAVGSAPGILVMTIDKSYTFMAHLRFLPAILVNFIVTLLVWHIQCQVLMIK
jgi:Na+/H+ antiporter NhaD/arsenite permease-like protein